VTRRSRKAFGQDAVGFSRTKCGSQPASAGGWIVEQAGSARLQMRLASQIALAVRRLQPLNAARHTPRFHAHVRVFAAAAPDDLRRNFIGLRSGEQQQQGKSPKNGAQAVFRNPPGAGNLNVAARLF